MFSVGRGWIISHQGTFDPYSKEFKESFLGNALGEEFFKNSEDMKQRMWHHLRDNSYFFGKAGPKSLQEFKDNKFVLDTIAMSSELYSK